MRVWTGCLLAATMVLASPGGAALPRGPAWQVEASLGRTSNLFRSYSQRSEWLRQVSVDITQPLGRVSLAYWGQADLFSRYPDLRAQTHGLVLSLPVRRAADQAWSLEVDLSRRDSQPGYEYKEREDVSLQATGRGSLRPGWPTRFGVRSSLRRYRYAPAYSHGEVSVPLQLSHSWPSRTTVLAGCEAAAKVYLRTAGATGDTVYSRLSGPRVQGLGILWVRLAQNLGPGDGVQLESRRQLSTGTDPYSPGDKYDTDSELFDDAYGQQVTRVQTAWRHRGRLTQWRVTAYRESRTYQGRPALDLAGSPLPTGAPRHDRRQGTVWTLEQRLPWWSSGGGFVALGAEATVEGVDSNDAYFSTSVRSAMVSLRFGR